MTPLVTRILAGALALAAIVAALNWWTSSIERRGYERGRADVQALRVQDALQRSQEDTARVRATLRQSEVHREEEARREAAKQKEVADARLETRRLALAAAAADRVAVGLRDQLATFVADARSRADVPADSGAAQRGAAADSALDLLAELYRGADSRAGELAQALDVSRAAGLRCERLWDAMTPAAPP